VFSVFSVRYILKPSQLGLTVAIADGRQL